MLVLALVILVLDFLVSGRYLLVSADTTTNKNANIGPIYWSILNIWCIICKIQTNMDISNKTNIAVFPIDTKSQSDNQKLL